MGSLLLPVSFRQICDHVRCFTKFQTTKDPFGAGHRKSQPAPVAHPGHRQASQPSWGTQEKQIPERATGNSSSARGSQEGNSIRGTPGGAQGEGQKGPRSRDLSLTGTERPHWSRDTPAAQGRGVRREEKKRGLGKSHGGKDMFQSLFISSYLN